MIYPVAYDITRLASRLLNATPNGIDRVDLAFARHFLEDAKKNVSGLVYLGKLSHRLVNNAGAIAAIDKIEDHFREFDSKSEDMVFQSVRDWLIAGGNDAQLGARRLSNPRRVAYLKAAHWLLAHGGTMGKSVVRFLPQNARYVCVSQFPLSIDGAYGWLRKRPDVKPVFFIHDLLPLQHPEYFRQAEMARHKRRIKNLALHGAGAIVSSAVVKDLLNDYLGEFGRKDLPILVAPMPISPIFFEKEAADVELSRIPYFVQCGTLEPRKNHLMILNVWRELVMRHGARAPKLVIIGARGWENENIIDMLERCPALRGKVLEVSGLTTPGLKHLMAGAKALLMPSFAEGYGLPVAEALALQIPVIASDIPVFHEIGNKAFTPVSPIDGEGWLRAIMDHCAPTKDIVRKATASNLHTRHSPNFFEKIDEFFQIL